MLRSPARRHTLALLSYGLLSLFFTYPLVLHFTTHVPGDGIDDPALAWNLWWVRFSIIERHANPFDCRWIFWPIGVNLAFYTLTVLNGLLSVPLQLAFDLVPASNALLLSSFTLSGYGAFLLAWQVWAPRRKQDFGFWAAAWLAGLIYAFAANKLFYAALGQFNIASSQWIPFCVLYLWRMGQPYGRLRDAVLAGLFLGLQAWAESTFASFLLILIALYALWQTTECLRWGLPAWIGRLACLAIIFVAAIAPMLANMLPDLWAEGDFFTSGGGFADVFSADLAGYLVPLMHHPLFGSLVVRMPFPHDKGQHVYLGYGVMALALLGLWARPRRIAAFWGTAAFAFWLFTLGPALHLMGQEIGVPGPFALVDHLPFFKGNRYPSRYAVMLLLSVSMLAAPGLAMLHRRLPMLRPQVLLGMMSLLFTLEHIAVPLPLSDLRVPAIYRRIAVEADPTPGSVMELPLGWRNGARVTGKKDVIIMFEQWYQTVHHRPILGGNTSRNPEFKFQYFSEAPLLDRLIAMVNAADEPLHQALRDRLAQIQAEMDTAPPEQIALHRQQVAQVLRILDIAYVVIHRERVPAELERYVARSFPVELVAVEDDLALYRVDPLMARGERSPRLLTQEIELASDIGHLLLGEGWGQPARSTDISASTVWAQRRQVRMQLPVSSSTRGIALLARAPGPGQEVALMVDGKVVDRQPVPETWGWVRLTWEPGQANAGLLPVRLRFSRLYGLHATQGNPHPLPNGSQVGATLVIRSAGEEVGNFAHVYVNGMDWSPGRRGYNLVELVPESGRVTRVASFDTHISPEESQAMADWLRAVPPDRWVLGAVQDEASLNLTEEAVAALRELGVTADLRGHFRWSHAFIGARGWSTGEAIEAVEAFRPATIVVGPGLTEPYMAMEVASVRFLSENP
ncbi:MAG: interleukin-like EMT inducer domain-containing protein [Anaerolineae bacterium]|nr:hypothetical protein [Anaerolineae bacterium]MDW8100143.1 interleukin-like EMT inducer domain-containing protein [Anaerolineae bacterium]